MRVLRRLKRPVRRTSYKEPEKRVIITRTQFEILKRLDIPVERYAKEIIKSRAYKNRYGG